MNGPGLKGRAARVTGAGGTRGRIDNLVNNASVLNNPKLDATTAADWRRVMAANLDGGLIDLNGGRLVD